MYLLFDSKRISRKMTLAGELPNDSALLKKTLAVAWPAVLEAVLVAIVAFVDSMMVAVLGDEAIAAVGLTNQPKMLSLALFMALSPAVAALVARRKGEDNRESAVRAFKLASVITVAASLVIGALACIFANEVMHFAGSNEDTHAMSVVYFRIITAGTIFNALTMTINAAQRGAGNTKISMKTSLTSNLVNIVFNYLLIGGNLGFPKLGVAGAAIATVLGTVVALVMACVSISHPDGYIYARLKTKRIFEGKTARSLVSLCSSTFVEQLFLRVGFFVYAIIIAALGTTAFTTHQIAMNVMTVSFAFGDGLSHAAIALVGYSLGQKRGDLARIYGSFCQRLGLLVSLCLSAVYLIFGKAIIGLFSQTPQVLSDGTTIMRLMTVIVIVQISQVIYSGCLRGSGDAKYMAIVSFLNIAILRPGIAYIMVFVLGRGLIGAWLGLILDQCIRLLMTAVRFSRGRWMRIDL